jgi:hypothetical protein
MGHNLYIGEIYPYPFLLSVIGSDLMVASTDSIHSITSAYFSRGFWKDHARTLIENPRIAIVEIVANCWDAGADQVEITWPSTCTTERISVKDNGHGMTGTEFIERWRELSYNRVANQGGDVVFPFGNQTSQRKAFGRNGKGRHSMFCFNSEYFVETWRDGKGSLFKVTRSSGKEPFIIEHESQFEREGHGTEISATLLNLDNYLTVESLSDLIGSKFVADPSFRIYINGQLIELADLEHLTQLSVVHVEGYGEVSIHQFDSRARGRTSKQHGVAWWVHKRLVGEPSWSNTDFAFLDARTSPAKQYTFVVQADILADQVEADWSRFHDSEKYRAVLSAVNERILQLVHELFADVRKDRKKDALRQNRENLRHLPISTRKQIGTFADEIQVRVPRLGQKELVDTIGLLSKLEQARTGYTLLEQIASLPLGDLDALSRILENWSIREAEIVLDELDRRLNLIERLSRVVENQSDELHEIQPLIENGLWIFGPEYEGVYFTSNQSLATVVKKLFSDRGVTLLTPRRRPDFVVLADASIGIFSRDGYDDRGEVDEIDKILIVELKRGNYEVGVAERRQAEDYAREIKKSGKIAKSAEIVCFVLGTTKADDAIDIEEGNTQVRVRTYNTLLRLAHARTFHLSDAIKKKRNITFDPEVENIISEGDQLELL